jgi:hypothetical protein
MADDAEDRAMAMRLIACEINCRLAVHPLNIREVGPCYKAGSRPPNAMRQLSPPGPSARNIEPRLFLCPRHAC